MRADQIIIEPILSEKSNVMRDAEVKKYTFRVAPEANKFEIMNAVKELFGVNCISCNVMNMAGKPKFSRGRGGYIKGSRSSWKKAIVTVAKGESISAIEGV
ncbi:MAG TPA: 50S ribosomal protein L23 [Candidatus Ornithospirochaeta avicola]|uniref:Large ribosomal subunit protein uL23 n=1 Tax=Candidatus Ornithospirochaeta avicola TaxID=2840896 RepID=A0A9D1PT65_9SPIO|nr:50S ribosomal protein L23 [Candidatus Ornithospirochaeta avicola]